MEEKAVLKVIVHKDPLRIRAARAMIIFVWGIFLVLGAGIVGLVALSGLDEIVRPEQFGLVYAAAGGVAIFIVFSAFKVGELVVMAWRGEIKWPI